MANLFGINKYWDAGGLSNKPHVVIALLGQFKGETGEWYHLLPLLAKTSSGLELCKWVGQLILEYGKSNIINGPMF